MKLGTFGKLMAGLSFFACTSLFAAPLTVDVTGIQSYGELGDAGNTVLTYNVGANATISSISYAFNLTAFDPSYLNEIRLSISDSAQLAGFAFAPGPDDFASGTASYAYTAGPDDLGPGFQVGSDGILRLEFYDAFDDFAGADGQWNFGSITFGIDAASVPGEVPEPATALLIGAGMAMLGAGRRRRAAKQAH